ncbi:electron transport complex subunit RsxC [Paludibacter sp. 221]|uniref:electron transport complex subunit RsxC n=1 Tax=Paludibacter sp. 221 TaxID=2302939 RepID=UPI0013D1EAAB|nr:electron transport complex subunit RsxC [Paludibacter sp. 221]NDV46547.1 electron transport complex subunit RsxC [Paludibacter sp. 221]
MKTFKIGGIHPNDNKFSAGKRILPVALPKQVIIPLAAYLGAPSVAVVEKGEKVKAGQLVGKANGFVSSNVHSSVSGKVVKIEPALDASGYKRMSVFIDVEGDEWMEGIDRSTEIIRECRLTKEEIIQKIHDAGIVGLGGATFPAHVKLTPPPGKKAEVLVINAVECEPYLTCDHQLMMEHTEEILIGISILMKALQVERTVIGIENNKKDAIELFKNRIQARSFDGIEVVALKVQYPQGGEKQLIDAAIGRQVPSGALPIEVGAVVQNVGTVFAIYEAVQKNKPLIERVVTITGKSLLNPGNYMVRIGTPLANVVELAGGMPADTGKIIGGGPMMGRALMSLDIPTAKGSAGVLFMAEDEARRKEMKNCIRCAKCVSVCPMGLEPFLLMAQGEREMWPEMENDRVMDCIECGSCSYTCPANRPLLDYIRQGKFTVSGIIRNRKTPNP